MFLHCSMLQGKPGDMREVNNLLTDVHLFEKCFLNLTSDWPVIKTRPEQGSISVLKMTPISVQTCLFLRHPIWMEIATSAWLIDETCALQIWVTKINSVSSVLHGGKKQGWEKDNKIIHLGQNCVLNVILVETSFSLWFPWKLVQLTIACSRAELGSNSSSVLGDELASAWGRHKFMSMKWTKWVHWPKRPPVNPSALPGLSTFFSQWLFSLNFAFKSAGLLCLSPSQSQLMGGSQYALLKQPELPVSMVAVTCWVIVSIPRLRPSSWCPFSPPALAFHCHCPLWLPWGLLVVV